MIPNPHSRRLDPRWLSTPIKTDGEELFGALDADLRSAATESTNKIRSRPSRPTSWPVAFEMAYQAQN